MKSEDDRKPTERFSKRVSDYRRFRPDYPQEILSYLREKYGLQPRQPIADIGAGTGILSLHFLRNGNPVLAIEPNADMRAELEESLSGWDEWVALPGSAEATGLPDNSCCGIVAGQAFHWFNPDMARKEFIRILKPEGWVALIWNDRLTDVDPFLIAYERLLQRYSIDYSSVDHKRIGPHEIHRFFESALIDMSEFPNDQALDLDGLLGRCFSSSYVPERHTRDGRLLCRELERLFDRESISGQVKMKYVTRLFVGTFQNV